jgi:uncharacterized membrane protein YfcA
LTLDRVMGVLAMIGFIAFLSILFRVPDTALRIVLGLIVAMAAFDFWLALRPRSRNGRKDGANGG